jgi:basic amino acid/polyamine antiporter, APA family
VLILGILLSVGVRESARVNAVMVFIKLLAIAVFVTIASGHVQPANWTPFMPFGWGGVLGGAALVVFAYLGFDAVSTAAEESRNPQRDLPIGILASLAVCTLLYILVAGLLTGVAHYSTLNVSDPVAEAILRLGYPWGAGLVAAGAIAGLTTVMLAMYYGLTRVFLAIARDGLLPPLFARVSQRTQTPVPIILASGIVMAFIAGFTPIDTVAKLVNLGTLAAFFLVSIGVLVLRRTHPDLPRPFRTPFTPLFPILGAASCLLLAVSLLWQTWLAFGIWLAVGLLIYFGYSRYHSALARNT